MRGGRNIVERGAKAGWGASDVPSASSTFPGMRTCRIFGRPWNQQHEQIPLQLSGATG
jgi:hypothetical protein